MRILALAAALLALALLAAPAPACNPGVPAQTIVMRAPAYDTGCSAGVPAQTIVQQAPAIYYQAPQQAIVQRSFAPAYDVGCGVGGGVNNTVIVGRQRGLFGRRHDVVPVPVGGGGINNTVIVGRHHR